MQQLQFMKGMILQRIREETGITELDDLRFFLGQMDASEGQEEKQEGITSKTEENLTDDEKEKIRKEVAGLSDPEMRRIFEKVFSRGLAAGKAARRGRKQEAE